MTPTFKLYQGDCLDILPTLEAGSVDAVITDPPYGIGYASSRTTQLNGQPRKSRSSFGADVANFDWIPYCYDALSTTGFLYCFTRWDVCHKWHNAIETAGFSIRQRIVWNKCHWKMGDLRYYGNQVEDVLFCTKGNPVMRYSQRTGNLFSSSSSAYLPEGQYDHPTQKSESIIAQFVEDATAPGDWVLDPFMGSGTTGAVCLKTGRNFIGIEIDADYFRIAEQRIRNAAGEIVPMDRDIKRGQLSLFSSPPDIDKPGQV